MDARMENERTATKHRTTVERRSERELVVTRSFNAPARIVFEAWTKPELLERWWVPKSIGMTLLSCEADVRVGGMYRFVFRQGASESVAFYGRYIEVEPPSRLVWTNEESEDGPVTTLTLEEKSGKTLLVMHELHPSKEALDAAIASGHAAGDAEWIGALAPADGAKALPVGGGMDETFSQLDDLLVTLGASVRRS